MTRWNTAIISDSDAVFGEVSAICKIMNEILCSCNGEKFIPIVCNFTDSEVDVDKSVEFELDWVCSVRFPDVVAKESSPFKKTEINYLNMTKQ